MTDDEALETLFAMANVQDGYAKKATDPGLKVIHKANAKAQREVAAVISGLRAGRDRWETDAKFWENRENEAVKRAEKAEADRDRLAAANAALEAQVARLVGALNEIDALDPEHLIDGCSQAALRGLVLRMGEIARAALAEVQADAHREGGE